MIAAMKRRDFITLLGGAIGAIKGAAVLGTRANTCIVARDLINALHNADRRGK
jgi:hypothetical protein